MKARIILSTPILALGIVLLQTGCESRKKAEKQYEADSLKDDKTAYDTTYKTQEVAEPVLAESERHFDAAVKDLDLKSYEKAAKEIGEGISALRKEGVQDKGALKAEFEKSVSHLQDLQKLATAGKLTSAELKKGFWPAEMMVTHYKIEKWESIPEFEVKTNDHLREALDGLERKTADMEASTRDEGKKLIVETRAHLKAAEQDAGTDASKAKADLKLETAKLKAYIKKNL
ncbi:MAG: hypothetical protein J7619_01195 [Dyadobacter sp.]|uniref:hypothetical protein n=1 Tax=Dyadobacter sp. TaxID=1914288 RepID=UPI001B24743E|nr:hypothetical protein [Dyadobacter sp.]MBO9611274.1 hypothetical protein [Dyadobacter sp.]